MLKDVTEDEAGRAELGDGLRGADRLGDAAAAGERLSRAEVEPGRTAFVAYELSEAGSFRGLLSWLYVSSSAFTVSSPFSFASA